MAKNLSERWKEEIRPALNKELGLSNTLQTPRPLVGYIQIGVGKMIAQHSEAKNGIMEQATLALNVITGRKPKIIPAKNAIAGFRVREGQPVALLVTLRKQGLLEFIDRFLAYALPRAKEFKGLQERNFDTAGNLNLGLRELNVFPEAVSDKIKMNFGIQVTLVGSGASREENVALWKHLGFPLERSFAPPADTKVASPAKVITAKADGK